MGQRWKMVIYEDASSRICLLGSISCEFRRRTNLEESKYCSEFIYTFMGIERFSFFPVMTKGLIPHKSANSQKSNSHDNYLRNGAKMNDMNSKRRLVAQDFCWDELVASRLAMLSPEELRQCLVDNQLASLGASVYELRHLSGRTMENVSTAAGVKVRVLSNLENIEQYPSLQQFVSIIHELGGELLVVRTRERDSKPI